MCAKTSACLLVSRVRWEARAIYPINPLVRKSVATYSSTPPSTPKGEQRNCDFSRRLWSSCRSNLRVVRGRTLETRLKSRRRRVGGEGNEKRLRIVERRNKRLLVWWLVCVPTV